MCRFDLLNFLRLFVFCLLATGGVAAQSGAASEWKREQLAGGIEARTPNNLNSGETYSLILYGAQNLNGQTLTDFLRLAIQNDPLGLGDIKKIKIEAASDSYATATSAVLINNIALGAAYIAVKIDQERIYLARVLVSNQHGLSARYQAETQRIVGAAVENARNQISLANNNSVAKDVLPAAGGDRLGGELVEGIYAGDQLYDEKEVRNHLRLYLYANGEYRMTDKNGQPVDRIESLSNGEYKYDSRTGKIGIGGSRFDLDNDSSNPKEWFCFYGRAKGTPFIYGKRYRGFGWVTTRLRYVGVVDKPSLTAEKETKRAAEAEAKRYKFVVAPGAGLKQSQIAHVLLDGELVYNGLGYNAESKVYVLLTDNTIYQGFPVAPDEWDAALSRRMEPEKWGRWRREGAKILAAWSDNPNKFAVVKGDLVKPAGKNDQIMGRFGTGESGGSLAGSYWSLWGVTFTDGNRFLKDKRGGAGNSQFMQNGGQPAINTVYDDNGSVTSATTESSVVMAKRKNNPNGDREGSYSVDGYVITLRYDDGRVVRQPFFFLDNDRDNIWFEDALLGLDKDKK